MALREFTDERGRSWLVWSTFPATPDRSERVREHLSNGWLTFTSGKERRRLVPIPAEWDEADEDELRRWLAQAQIAPPIERL